MKWVARSKVKSCSRSSSATANRSATATSSGSAARGESAILCAMPQRIAIYDTTLRDGSQAEGVNFSLDDKIRIARKLDEFGMDYIEGGWPGSNPKDIELFERLKTVRFCHSKLAA